MVPKADPECTPNAAYDGFKLHFLQVQKIPGSRIFSFQARWHHLRSTARVTHHTFFSETVSVGSNCPVSSVF
jgi:hypothetical protein